ncbi:hypothetical protein Efla_001837 [Eimeria flavescens]
MSCCACDFVDLAKEAETLARGDPSSSSSSSSSSGDSSGCRLQFVQAGKSVQHPLKAALRSTNADAFAGDATMIGIADGVSTVEDEGLDPSELPVELLSRCLEGCRLRSLNSLLFDAEAEDLLAGCEIDLKSSKLPLYVLTRASTQCRSFGSTTCVLGILEDSRLWTVNIGDSQMLLVRRTSRQPKAYPGPHEFSYSSCHDARARVPDPQKYGGYQIVYRTTPQQHFFNCPFQLSRMPDMDCSWESILKKTAESADVGSVDVHPGDIVVCGTDGLFDNLFDDDLLDLLNRLCWADTGPNEPPKTDPAVLVDALLDIALKAGQPPPGSAAPVITPFSKAAFDEVGRRLLGGKPDDITVVVAYVVSHAAAASAAASPAPASPAAASPAAAAAAGQQAAVSPPSQARTVKRVDSSRKETAAEARGLRPLAGSGGPPSEDDPFTQSGGGAPSHLTFLNGLGGSSVQQQQQQQLQHQKRLRLPPLWSSRSSFPPRPRAATTPANKASVHSLPLSVAAADVVAFERLKQRARHRMQTVEASRPSASSRNSSSSTSTRSSTTSSSGGRQGGWLTEKSVVLFTAVRGLFFGS